LRRSVLRFTALAVPLLAPLVATACNFARFSELESSAPVVLLNHPGAVTSFGVSIAAASGDDDARVLVGGTPGPSRAAFFDLGFGTSPKADAIDVGACSGSPNPCTLADHPAALPDAEIGHSALASFCFVLGVGHGQDSSTYGLIGRCGDGTEYTLPVPATVLKNLIQNDVIGKTPPAPLVLSADRDVAPALAAGAKKEKLAWSYAPKSRTPIALVPPGTPDASYGAAVTIVRLDGGFGGIDGGVATPASRRIVAVGAPDAAHVWLFDGDSGSAVGCFGGPTGFGRTLASGRVRPDALGGDDLVVADATNVTVISGSALRGLTPTNDITCSLAALPPDGIVASFGCGSRKDTTGCPGSFGAALDVGDLDGDGDGEVLVGAPGLDVRGSASAGAVLVYDAEGPAPSALTDQLFLSDAKTGDDLGSMLAAVHIRGRDVVVAAVPGSSRAAVFYCSSLLADGVGGERCQ
jgi:hypothetical protein